MLYKMRASSPVIRLTCVLAGVLIVAGCGSGPPKRQMDSVTVMYDKSEVQEFDEATGPPRGVADEYFINVGDHLDIVFLYHNNLTMDNLLVRPDGRISMPYIGDEMAAGRTPMMLDSVLTARFSEILREPSLSVILRSSLMKRVYVLGEVQAPGQVDFENVLTIAQAIASVGGPRRGAKTTNALVIRREAQDRIVGVEIDLKAILSGEALENDVPLRSNDIVYIPKTRVQSAADFASQFRDIIGAPLDVAQTAWQIRNLQITYEFFKLEKDRIREE